MANSPTDDERNRLTGRVKRYAKVGAGVGGFAVKAAGSRLLGRDTDAKDQAEDLRAALGGLKGPLMKVAQMMATIPDLLPEDFAVELSELQTNAPSMGWPFVRRRMTAELGTDWQSKFASFEKQAAAAASLGQVHKAIAHDGRDLACKLQYPDMQSAVEADLDQLNVLMSVYKRMDNALDTSEMGKEIAARLREELDYVREAKHMALYRNMLSSVDEIHVPDVLDELSTGRLLTMTWLTGESVLAYKDADLETRNRIATNMFHAWWKPFVQYGVIHGDPHLGNYTVRDGSCDLNLLDFGCVRIFPADFVQGVVDLYQALKHDDRDAMVAAYETWGFKDLSQDLIDALNIWARFIYGPLLDDRVRTLADGVKPSAYGRREAYQLHLKLRELGPVKPPREFVFMDRAAIGLGSVYLHLNAELNFYRLFNDALDEFGIIDLAERQKSICDDVGLSSQDAMLEV